MAGRATSLGRITVLVVVRAVPPEGVNVVATRRDTRPDRRAACVAAFSLQVMVSAPARAAVRDAVQAVTRRTACAPAAVARRVPRCVMRPAPGTTTRVDSAAPRTAGLPTTNVFEGVVDDPDADPPPPPAADVPPEDPDAVKVAVTLRAWVMGSEHVVASPVHAPCQPAKADPLAGTAVSVTVAPEAKDAVQVAPQLMPEGADVTVPDPLPLTATVRA